MYVEDCEPELFLPTSRFRSLCFRQPQTMTLQVPSVEGRLMILDSKDTEEAKEIVLGSAWSEEGQEGRKVVGKN